MIPQDQRAGWILLICQLFAAALCVPLIRGRVRRNGLYGLRTAATLVDDRVWYEANRVTSWAMLATTLLSGLVTGLWLLCLFVAPLWALSTVWVASLVGVSMYGVWVGRRLSRENLGSD